MLEAKPQNVRDYVSEAGRRRLGAILALDVAGYSAQAETNEAEAARQVAVVRARIGELAPAQGGRVFNTAGDGVMAEFSSAMAALEVANALVEAQDLPPIRIGVHVGEVIVTDGGDLLGHDVNIAARLEQQAERGTALISAAAQRMARGPIAERLRPAGEKQMGKMEAAIPCFVLHPSSRPQRFAVVMPRRRIIVMALAGGAAALALFSLIWSVGVVGPNREAQMRAALRDPAAMRALAAEVTATLVSDPEASQDTMDGAHRAVLSLARSPQAADLRALSFLEAGAVAQAVRAMETFAEDLMRRGDRADAAAAFGRAGALAMFHDKARAVADFRRAYALDPTSVDRFADLLNGVAAAEGYRAASIIADEVVRRRPAAPEPIVAYAYLASAVMAGDLGQTDRQRAFVQQAEARVARLDDPYLDAVMQIQRGYLAFGEGDMGRARQLYIDGRRRLQAVPGHERDSQQGWLLALLAMGDLETAWRDGRAFIAEREEAGAPPQPALILNTCIAGVMLGRTREAGAFCRAAAQGLAGGANEATGQVTLGMLAAENGDLVRARAALEAARASPSYRATPAVPFWAGRLEANIAARAGDFPALEDSIARTGALVRETPGLRERRRIYEASLQSAYGAWAVELGQMRAGCAALATAGAHYAAINAAPGQARMQSARRAAGCA